MISNRLWLTVWCISVVANTSSGQACHTSFTGTVHAASGEALPGASVVLLPQQLGTVAGDGGSFRFANLCPGTYTAVVQYVGYAEQRVTFTVIDEAFRAIVLVPDVRQLAEVVVQDVHDETEHAQHLSILHADDLARTAGKSLGESLKALTGVTTIQSGPGIFKPVIHGVHSQRVLILNHGIRQEGQQWGAEHAPEIDPFVASSIAVVKDAAAIKYGSEALGGVVIVNPAPLPETPGIGGALHAIAQSNGRSGTLSGLLEGGLAGLPGWGWRVQGTGKRSGDFHAPDYSLTNTGLREADFSLATGYHGSEGGFEVFFSHFETDLGILRGTAIANLDDLENAIGREPPLYTRDFSYAIDVPRQQVSHDLLKLTGHLDQGAYHYRFQYGFQHNSRQEFDLRRGSLTEIPSIDLDLFSHTVEVEWEKVQATNKSICLGISGLLQENNNVFGTQRIPFIPDFTQASAGAFAVWKTVAGEWNLDMGVRYDYRHYAVSGFDFKNTLYKAAFQFHNPSATLGASRKHGPYGTVKLSLSNAWRPPHVAELYSLGTHQSAAAIEYGLLLNDSTNEVMDIDDVAYSNEQAWKAVATYRHEKGPVSWEVTGFANYLLNYIYLRPVGVTQNIRGVYPAFRYSQTDALFIGIDALASWNVSPSFTVEGKASLLRAKDVRNNDYFVYIPPSWYAATVRYARAKGATGTALFAEAGVRYVARQRRAPRVITIGEWKEALATDEDPLAGSQDNFDFLAAPAGYALINASAGMSFGKNRTRYEVRLSAENLMNTSYRDYTNRLRYYADDIGRNFTLSLKTIF